MEFQFVEIQLWLGIFELHTEQHIEECCRLCPDDQSESRGHVPKPWRSGRIPVVSIDFISELRPLSEQVQH